MSKAKFKVGDKVKILDGTGISDYTGGWNRLDMTAFVGQVAEVRGVREFKTTGNVGYSLKGNRYLWDERGLQPVAAMTPRKIIVMQDKADPMKVIARDLDTGKVGVAKCSPQDAFDFCTGAKLAFDRLMGREEKKPEEPKPEPEKPKLYSGKVVCVKKATSCWFWTPGKVYEITDGVIRDDDGDPRRNLCSVAALNKTVCGAAEFIEYKGGA